MTSPYYHLPRLVEPLDYEITLDASPKRPTFAGALVLTLKVLQPTSCFELNARALAVSDVLAVLGRLKLSGTVRSHPKRETLELIFDEPLPKGILTVSLMFQGKLNPSMHGLYLAQDGPEQALVTQCEATDARAIFPCFDEPHFKATLRWRVRTDAGLQVITNGALESSHPIDGTSEVLHVFKRTNVIPTYLAAVTIGTFEGTPAMDVEGIPCRIWAGQGKLGQTDFAKEVTAYVLPWYQSYFGQKYHYGKLDQVAVPGFDAGAMENVGAIFYRQNLLLMHPEATSWQAQKRIAEVIAHEVAHQWFGNLVTMGWWDDLWLNEAFATWIAYKVCDLWKPQWRMWDDYLESKEAALAADALINTHPIYTEVQSPAEATELFDVITYEKGCSVLRMVESYLGSDVFQQGIQLYQAAYQNGNATGADLWDKLAQASQQPVGDLMQSWIRQSGFPIVSVVASQNASGTVLHVTQKRFFANAGLMQKDDHAQRWIIPLVIRYDLGNGPQEYRALLRDHELRLSLPEEGHVRWVYANADATGFYRLHCEDEVLHALLEHGLEMLTPAERMGLLEDQWALVQCGLSNIEPYMDVLAAFKNERDHAVVRCMVGRLNFLRLYVATEDDLALLAAFTRWLLAPQLQELSWEPEPDEPPSRSARRARVVYALGDIGRDEAVLHQSIQNMEAESNNPYSMDPNVAGVCIALAALDGDHHRLTHYVSTYLSRKQHKDAPELQSRYLSAFSAFERPKVVPHVLELCIHETVPQEQIRTVLVAMLHRRSTQQATWHFLKKHWFELSPRIGSMGIARLVEAIGALPIAYRDDVATFFEKHPVLEAQRALQKALEAMDLRQELLDRETSRLSDWLKNASYQGVSEAC